MLVHKGVGGWGVTASMSKYIMLPDLVLLIEYSTQMSEVFKNFITFQSFSLHINAKTKFKTSKKLKRRLSLLSFKTQDRIPATRYKVSHRSLVGKGLCYHYLGGIEDTDVFDHPPPHRHIHIHTHTHTHTQTQTHTHTNT